MTNITANPKFFYVYKITNDLDKQFYIGSHYGKINDSYLGSGKNIKNLIKKYGKTHFNKEIIHICDDRLEMINKEHQEIMDNINNPYCLNETTEVKNCYHTQDDKIKISEASKCHWKDESYRNKILSHVRNQSIKTRNKISESLRLTHKLKKQLGISVTHSTETKTKISQTLKKTFSEASHHDRLILAARKHSNKIIRAKTNKSEDFDDLWRKRLKISQKLKKINKINNMKYFSINELIYSSTARKLKIINEPPEELIENGVRLIKEVLDPIREKWGSPIHVNSGYRCPALNKAVGGVKNSNHMKFRAADITVGTSSENKKLYTMILKLKDKLPINELILEQGGVWIHISVKG